MATTAPPVIDYETILVHIQSLNIPTLDFVNHLICSFAPEEQIGHGGAMTVYKALFRHDSSQNQIEVALKVPNQTVKESSRDKIVAGMLADIRQEIRIMKHLEADPHIVDLYGVAFRDLKPILVVELATANLADYLVTRMTAGNRVNWQTKARFCYEVADGIKSIHSVGIVHGDIKADNILLFGDETDEKTLIPKLSDFGYSSTVVSIAKGKGTGGTPNFLPPECTSSAPPEMKVHADEPTKDNYSYGLYVWQVATDGEIPYEDMDVDEMDSEKHSDKELQELMHLLPEDTPESFKRIIIDMTQYNPKERKDLTSAKSIMIGIGEMDKSVDSKFTEAKGAIDIGLRDLSQNVGGIKLFESLQEMSLPQSIKRKLVRTYEMAASKGDINAAYFLSICYGSEFGVKLDKTKMVSFAIQAAEGGSLEAVKSIAFSSDIDQLPENRVLLFPWLLKAAEAGDKNSQLRVYTCYMKGICVEADDIKYNEWFYKWMTTKSSDSEILLIPEPALHTAVRKGNINSVKFFIQQEGIDVNVKNARGNTPVHVAAAYGQNDVLKLLVTQFGADLNIKDNDGSLPLSIAASSGQIETVKLLITEFKADVNITCTNDWTPVHQASIAGHLEILKLLTIEYGADTNAKGFQGCTALHLSAQQGHMECLKFLMVQFKPDVNIASNDGWTPLILAAQNGHIEIVKSLIVEFGADINITSKYGMSSLHKAAGDDHIEIVKLLITEHGMDVNITSSDGWTPLSLAALNGHTETVKLLIAELGADTQIKTKSGWTPLHAAALNGHIEIVKLLVIEFGADVNSKNDDGWTSLHVAANRGNVECIKLLIEELGADVNAVDCKGRTPIFLSLENGYEGVTVSLLEQFHANPNWKNEDGETILHLAVKYRQEAIVKLLLEKFNLDIHAKDAKGHSPLELADMPPTHCNVSCDGCKIYPIIGERHKCTTCEGFDFCDTCYSSDHNHGHVFDTVVLPSVSHLLMSHC